MTCTRVGNAIVCTNRWGRLHVGNRYIYVEFHQWCGPAFTLDRAGNVPYEPKSSRDPVWPAFKVWLEKQERKQE